MALAPAATFLKPVDGCPQQILGIPAEVHEQVNLQEKEAYLAATPVTPSSIPGVIEVLNAPGLVAACDQLVGENWAIVPFTHNASFTSGPRDQHWHKDDNGPYNGRKQRHHQAVQIEMPTRSAVNGFREVVSVSTAK